MINKNALMIISSGVIVLAVLYIVFPNYFSNFIPKKNITRLQNLTGSRPTMYQSEELVQAAEIGDIKTIQRILSSGEDINSRDARGGTPVMAATHANKVDVVRLLINEGADINIQDTMADNPFLYAGAEGLLEILKLTIDANADTKLLNRYGGTALIPAADRGHVEIVKELLTRTDVDVNHVNNLGWTALLEAIILGEGGPDHTEIVRLLVEAGADVNSADKDGITPISHAKQRGYTKIVEILENAGAR